MKKRSERTSRVKNGCKRDRDNEIDGFADHAIEEKLVAESILDRLLNHGEIDILTCQEKPPTRKR